LKVNYHESIYGDVKIHKCRDSRREGVVREGVVEKDVVL